jgi:hypothetical protein
MRLILASIIILFGVNVGMKSIEKVDRIQEAKMAEICKVDPTLCQSTN